VKHLGAVLALVLPLPLLAQDTGDLVRFVSCPVYRDTDAGRKSGCWLVDQVETGQRWDVTPSPYKPDWNHEVLVEGRVSDQPPDLCGSRVLDPVRTSILPGRCPHHLIPAEGYPGRKYTLPERHIDPLDAPRKVPPGPYGPRTFFTFFEFDRDFLVYQYDDFLVDRMVTWLRVAKPRKVVVTGFAATDPETISGHVLAERPEVARERAEAVAITLRRLIPELEVETRWETRSKPIETPDADDIPGQSQRRAEVQALF
jgi:hypothetical protein